MKKGQGKSKGNSFERNIAKELSLFLTEGKESYAIWRSSSSGGHATILNKSKNFESFAKKNVGDLIQTTDKGMFPNVDAFFEKFFIEVKHYKEINLYPPFNKILLGFFEQLEREKLESGKCIFFVLKANNREPLLITDIELEDKLYSKIYINSKEYMIYLFREYINVKEDI